MSDYTSDAADTTLGLSRRPLSSAALDDVFDDPDHGEPGRDRMGVHAGWELALLLAVAAVGFLLYREHSDLLKGAQLRDLLVLLAGFGFVALGAAISLRASAPNLAVGPIAVAAAIFYATQGDRGVVSTTAVAAVIALVAGVVLAILVVGFHVPGWAASLAGALAVVVWIQRHDDTVSVLGEYDPSRHAYYLAAGFAAVSVIGGLLGSIKSVRRAIGRFRPVSDPARRRGGVAAGLTAAALIASTVLASIGGVLLAAREDSVGPGGYFESTGLALTGLAIGAALVGGTSAFGRRGGVFGTLLAVTLLIAVRQMGIAENWRLSDFAVAAVTVGVGLVVTRLVEAMGRPRSAGELEDTDDGWMSTGSAAPASSWSVPRQDSWSSSLPAQPSAGHTGDLWADDRWGGRSE
ncbi:MAG TPA: ABC transporter permease [Micromonosporaceae bacterium]|nr:ABC transporter permease [Micromonosporaceae bacterium]